MLSDTFFSAYRSLHRLDNVNNLKGWLIQIAKRRLYDRLQIQNREKKIANAIKWMWSEESEQEELFIKKQLKQVLYQAIDNLKQQYSSILKMKYIDKLSQKELSIMVPGILILYKESFHSAGPSLMVSKITLFIREDNSLILCLICFFRAG